MPSSAAYHSNVTGNALHGFLHCKLTQLDGLVPGDGSNHEGVVHGDHQDGGSLKRSRHLVFRMAIHEASHAVIRLYLGLGNITKITIEAPQGAYVAWEETELQEQTEEFFTAVLVATLAGRAGEREIIGTVGASGGGDGQTSDQAVATQVAFDMEAVMGFGQKWPLLYRATPSPQSLLAIDLDLAESVHARLDAAYKAARKMVSKQRRAIEHVAESLLLKGTLEGLELDRVLADTRQLIQE
jgi:cell division protease FtsH